MIRKYFYSLLFLTSIVSFDGNAADGNVKKGDQFYQLFDFTNAVKAYEIALKDSPDNVSIKEKIATSYRLMNNTTEMERWYSQVVKYETAAPINFYYYAQALRENEKYDEALKYYNEYSRKTKDGRPLEIINGYKYIQKLSKANTSIKLENIKELNSADMDFSPMFYRDTAVIFVSNSKRAGSRKDFWTQMNFLDLYISSKEKGKHQNYFDITFCYV